MKHHLLPQSGTFYKANLHCHSSISDGALSPEEIKRAYMDHGYSIIAYTDHDVMLDHSDLNEENFLALRAYEIEISEKWNAEGTWKTCHLCFIALDPDNRTQVCWSHERYLFGNAKQYADRVVFDPSVPDFVREHTPECVNTAIRTAREAGFFVTYNHPAWSMESACDYLAYEGMNAMEICNYSALVGGYEDYNPMAYDEMLRAGKRIICISADDNHNLHDAFGGFTMIKANKLDYRSVTKALEAGECYASQGPEIFELYYEDGFVYITCSPAAKISYQAGRRYAKARYPEEGELLTCASFPVNLEKDIYFRLTVEDASGKHANTRAYFCDELSV